jgi:hypothetical protein
MPITENTSTVGAITARGRALPGLLKMVSVIQEEPNSKIAVMAVPTVMPKAIPHR